MEAESEHSLLHAVTHSRESMGQCWQIKSSSIFPLQLYNTGTCNTEGSAKLKSSKSISFTLTTRMMFIPVLPCAPRLSVLIFPVTAFGTTSAATTATAWPPPVTVTLSIPTWTTAVSLTPWTVPTARSPPVLTATISATISAPRSFSPVENTWHEIKYNKGKQNRFAWNHMRFITRGNVRDWFYNSHLLQREFPLLYQSLNADLHALRVTELYLCGRGMLCHTNPNRLTLKSQANDSQKPDNRVCWYPGEVRYH